MFDLVSLPLGAITIYGQVFEATDLTIIALLIVLEGILSIDNALVLGLLAKRLPKHQQKKALMYGLIGAFVFRVIAIFTAALLLKLPIMKLLGGGYLIYVAVKHFFFEKHDEEKQHIRLDDHGNPIMEAADTAPSPAPGKALARFWPTVLVIELTDIAFAIDSILAALAFIPPSPLTPNPKLWVVIAGGMMGVILMRFAAVIFIRLLEKFPRFEISAYLLVIIIGLKLCLDWLFNSYLYGRPADWPIDKVYHGPLDFHSFTSPAFWVFWAAMLICFAIGFIRPKDQTAAPKAA